MIMYEVTLAEKEYLGDQQWRIKVDVKTLSDGGVSQYELNGSAPGKATNEALVYALWDTTAPGPWAFVAG